jgi:Condensation domain
MSTSPVAMALAEQGSVAKHTQHYLDVVDKFQSDRQRSYHQHHLTINFAIEGPTDATKLQAAVIKLAAANPALRSYFQGRQQEWTQHFADPAKTGAFSHHTFPDTSVDWASTSRAAVDRLNDENFDVTQPPLFKVVLLEFSKVSVILTKWHHIVCDGWGILVALNQLLGFYEAELNGLAASIPQLSLTDYLSIAQQQNKWLLSTEGQQKLGWWRRYLDNHAFITTPLAERPQGILGVCSDQLSVKNSAALFQAAEAGGFHASYLVHAAFLKGLQKLLGSDDILVTFVKANREQSTGGIIANFADWVMVRHQLKGASSLQTIAASAQKEVNEAKAQYLPYWHIVRELCPSQYFKDFGITPYSFDFVPPLQPKVDVGGKIKFSFLHELDAIPYRLVATDIFCRMSMHTYEGDASARINIDLIHHSGFVPKERVQTVLDTMKSELSIALATQP